MMRRALLVAAMTFVLAGCAQRLYHWGDYEDSLHVRVRDASPEGRQKAFRMLENTIEDAQRTGRRVPPGVYADYGYLLYRSQRADEAVRFFRQEAELYPEARPLMDAVISRIDAGKRQP
jgi:hypothetical protein